MGQGKWEMEGNSVSISSSSSITGGVGQTKDIFGVNSTRRN